VKFFLNSNGTVTVFIKQKYVPPAPIPVERTAEFEKVVAFGKNSNSVKELRFDV